MIFDIDQTLDQYFGPMEIQERHCMLFYYLSVFIVIMLTIFIGQLAMNIFRMAKQSRWMVVLQLLFIGVLISVSQIFIYYIYRILYSMCLKSSQKKDM